MPRFLASATLLVYCCTAIAHHSQSSFDRQTSITLDGVVTQYRWANPHVYIYVATTTDAGEQVVWEIEAQPPTILKRQGWSPDTVSVGDRVVVTASPSRNSNRNVALGTALQKADGTRLALGFNPATLSDFGPVSPNESDGLSGTWSTILERSVAMPIIVGPVARPDLALQNPFNWALTEKGTQAAEDYQQETELPGIDCIPFTSPFLMVLPDVKVIEIEDDVIRIRSEFEGVERVVNMTMTAHDGTDVSLQGHSIGHWEGEVLVVDTLRFADHRVGNALGLPSGASKHLVERFELNPDGVSLTYGFELEDPEYLAAPVRGEVQWAYRPDLEYSPAECDLDIARRFIDD